MSIEATAPGKLILFGEHSVVYKGSAIVLAIDKRAKVIASKRDDKKVYIDADDLGFSGYFENDNYYPINGKNWRGRNLSALNVAAIKVMEFLGIKAGVNLFVRSMIPIAVGLGSSAAVCVATTAAVGELFEGRLSKDDIVKLSYEGEKVIHGTPSGVDNNVATFGGIIKYERGVRFERLKLDMSLPFVIGNTKKKRSTKTQVDNVRILKDRYPRIIDPIIDTMSLISEMGLDALFQRNLPQLGDLMNINHGLLTTLGVSTFELNKLVHTALYEGALGAKLTGAGGGGCIIALAETKNLSNIEKAIRLLHYQPIRVNLTDEGVLTRRIDAGNS